MKSGNGSRRGYVLLPVAITVALIATLAFLLSRESALESHQVSGEIETAAAEYLTRAALQHALQQTARQGCGPYSDLADAGFGAHSYSSALTTDLGSVSTYTVAVDQDTFLREDRPDENKGSDLKMHIQGRPGFTERALLRYDLSAIPASSPILSATAWFYLTDDHDEGAIDIHLTTADWIEAGATWNNMSASMDGDILTSIPAQPVTGIWVPVDLTAEVQAWINGQPNYGIVMNSVIDGLHGQYHTRESSNPPYLRVVVGTPPAALASLRVSARLASGLSREITRGDVVLRQYPPRVQELVLSAVSGRDAVLDAASSSSNFGNFSLELESGSSEQSALIRFELPPIPPGARVLSAELQLYHFLTTGIGADAGIGVYRVTRDWVEGTRSGSGGADGATWNTWDGSSDWASAGGDTASPAVASHQVSLATGDRESWEIGPLVQRWIDGDYPNYGVLLRVTGDLDASFSSREDPIAERHPRLTIRYACACGEACALPRGSGNLLLVVRDDANPDAADLEKRALIESWGYSVNLIDQNTNQAGFDAAIGNSDVVLISETAGNNNASNRVADAPIGVITLGHDHNSNLGIASGAGWKIRDGIEITDSSHFITRMFRTGALKIFDAGMEQLVAAGTPAASARTLAESDAAPALIVIEAGGLLEGGGNAAGRRVLLPIGRHGDVNWNELNANGRLLLQRALAWGGSSLPGTSTGALLMVVGDPASLTAQERSRQLLFESWGFSVSLIDESDPAASFDAALANADAVFVSEEVSPVQLGGKLDEATAGIVIEHIELADDFGFSSGLNMDSGTQLDTAGTHYITLPLVDGTHTILTGSEPLAGFTAPLAVDIEVIGRSSAGDSLATLDTGDAILGGGTAPGRRVILPWGDGGFDIGRLNSTGLSLLQRSLEWAAGAAAPPMLMLVVDDPSNPGARDAGMRALFESWNYIVYLADDDDTQANLQALANALDVVYVSASVDAGALADKLAATSTGIVNEPGGTLAHFGFSENTGNAIVSDRFSQTNVSHYVTDPYAGAAVTHFNSSLGMPVVGGNLAPDLIGVASVGAVTRALSSLEKNARRWDDAPSAGRRIHLPFGNAAVADLSADGQTLLQRALEWALGAEEMPSLVAHWKLDDGAGNVAADSIGWNDAILGGNPVWTAGTLDGALEFDGGSDFATTINNFRPPAVGSVTFWMKVPGAPAAEGQVLGLDDAWEIRHVDAGTSDGVPSGLVFDLGVGGPNDEFVTTVALDAPGQWYFVAATYDSNSNAYQVYLDGTLQRSGTFSAGLSMPASNPLSLGRRTGSSDDFEGTLDEVRVYNYVLSGSEIQALYFEGSPNAKRYFELQQALQAVDRNRWETVSLAPYGVPPGAVVEVVVSNDKDNNERWGGVRATGSVLERRVRLHEAEGGGVDAVTMHVQADAASQIEIYAENENDVVFVVAGFWTGSAYQEIFQTFDETGQGLWIDQNLAGQGIGPNQIAEILIANVDVANQRQAGVRANGATHQRLFPLHEAENGGVDGLSLMVATDAAATIEVYAEDSGAIEFHVLGYWSDPPGTYTGIAAAPLQVDAVSAWRPLDLGPLAIPAGSVVQFALANRIDISENDMGIRKTGSHQDERRIVLHEAEGGGADLVSLHVMLDSTAQAEAYALFGPLGGRFNPLGWWLLQPP